MKTKSIFLVSVALVASSAVADAQTASDNMNATKKADNTILFDVNSSGKKLPVSWGMDTAWDDLYNVRWGVAHYGANFTTGRISFQPYSLVGTDKNDGKFGMPDNMVTKLKQRIDRIKLTGTTKVAINCDHEVLTRKLDSNGDYGSEEDNVGKGNYQSTRFSQKTSAWVNLIKAAVKYAQSQGLEVVSVSPFNEPDYGWNQYYNGGPGASESNQKNYGMRDFLAIAKALRSDTFFATGAGKNVRICGPNTLNCDRALPWYEYSGMADAIDEGNTHQLAGSFDNYAAFFKRMRDDGKVATADELHNVGEAIVGAEYGMQNGIWWAFDGKARGQFMMDSNEGVKIGYGENRGRWTSAAVYRNDKEGSVHGFIGTSERQANTTNYQFVSKSKDVYFNGMGPTRQWTYEIPGGTGYQQGQTNAELVFDITYGEDVAPFHPDGNYQIMSAADLRLVTSKGTPNDVTCESQARNDAQRWHIYPDNVRKSGDCSYWFIDNLADANQHLNLRDGRLDAGTKVLTYNASHDALEQWYLRYAKDGYFYIMARRSNKYLYNNNGSISVEDAPASGLSAAQQKRYLWRLLPADATAETTAPSAPTGLKAVANPASVSLNWTSVSEANATYTVLRSDAGEWNTIGRNISGTSFTDNTALPGRYYAYKVMAVDYSGNRSSASSSVSCAMSGANALIMNVDFENALTDATDSRLHPSFYGGAYDTSNFKVGSASYSFDGESNYAMLPYSVAAHDNMTIAMWVYWRGGSAWQRLFDFGNDESQYMFFTPSDGSKMRFVMRNGGDEEILECGDALSANTWVHVAVSIGDDQTSVYINGTKVASRQFTIKPSDLGASLCYLARSMYNADALFKGSLDDIRIYNFAMDDENVTKVYTNQPVSIPGTEPAAKDMTSMIVNPTINQTGTTNDIPAGWQILKNTTGNGHYTEGTGDTRLEAWHWTADLNADYYQDIAVPNGIYTLTAITHQRENGNAALYGETYRSFEQTMPVGDGNEAETSVTSILVTDGTLRIGVKVSGTANWMTADNFTLTYLGIPADLSCYTDAISYLDGLADIEMLRNVDHTALVSARTTAHSCEANADSYSTAINEYLSAIRLSQSAEEIVPPAVEAGDYFIVNAESGLFLNGANSYGTKASVTTYGQLMTLAINDDGTYTIDSHISNGGDNHYLGSGNNTYIDSAPASHTITSAGDGLFTIQNDGKYLMAGTDGIVNFSSADVTPSAKWRIVTSSQLMAEASSATQENPVDLSFLIFDANFSRNNSYISKWNGDIPTKGGKDWNMNAEKWGGNSTTFNSYQTLTGLPNGVYKLTAQGFYRYNNTTANTNDVATTAHANGTEEILAYLYANDVSVPLTSIADEASVATYGKMPFSQAEASEAFDAGVYNNELQLEVNDGTITLGVKKTSHIGTDWTLWDNMRLFYYGEKPAPVFALGDVNHDGYVNKADVEVLVDIVLGKSDDTYSAGDINGDEQLNIADISSLVSLMLGK